MIILRLYNQTTNITNDLFIYFFTFTYLEIIITMYIMYNYFNFNFTCKLYNSDKIIC